MKFRFQKPVSLLQSQQHLDEQDQGRVGHPQNIPTSFCGYNTVATDATVHICATRKIPERWLNFLGLGKNSYTELNYSRPWTELPTYTVDKKSFETSHGIFWGFSTSPAGDE